MPSPQLWTLNDFIPRLDLWVAQESPPDQVRIETVRWVFSRYDDPYQAVKREPAFENLWYGVVPGTLYGDGLVVVCSYWIIELDHAVRCESFASLSFPI